jgi:glycogen debranching enzyme
MQKNTGFFVMTPGSFHSTKLKLTAGNRPPSHRTTPTHYSAGFYLTNPELPISNTIGNFNNAEEKMESIPKESLAIHRMRFIEEDVREEYLITNVSETKFPFTLSFDVDSDFPDIFDVKLKAFGKRADMPQKTTVEARGRNVLGERWGNQRHISRVFVEQENAFDLNYTNYKSGFQAETLVWFSKRGRVNGSRISFDILLEPKQTHHLAIVIVILTKSEKRMRRYTKRYFQNQEEKIARALERWRLKIPRLETNWDELRHSYYESLVDLVSLNMGDPVHQYHWELPAAGCPWFMTIFGRDTLITSYQSMLFGSNLAMGAIEALAEYQAKELDESKDEEPGKIIHELRFGDYAASSKSFPYYGTVDVTPLFLILISEIYRWTKNIEFLNSHRKNIMSALSWIDNYGDGGKDGFVEYKKKAEDGLDNQCWKDSWNSIQFSNGEIAKPPIAACEIQGYVYDAKTRIAEIAKQCWKDDSLAKKLIDEAMNLGNFSMKDFGRRRKDTMLSPLTKTRSKSMP